MKKFIITEIFVVLLAMGCGSGLYNQPWRPLKTYTNKKEISSLSNMKLATAIHYHGNKMLFEEARERGLFTSSEIDKIKDGKIWRDMSETALRASWGLPSDINKSVGSYGIHKQYVYGSFYDRTYVYVEDGKVTGWQK